MTKPKPKPTPPRTVSVVPTFTISTPPPPPKDLSEATTHWWETVNNERQLDEHEQLLLQAACKSWDRMSQAEAALKVHGLTYTDGKGNPRARPEVGIERDSRLAFARLVRELGLNPADAPTRPPSLRNGKRY